MDKPETLAAVRLDIWLWAARFYKTRSLSSDEIDKGRVTVNGQVAKPSRDVRPQDTLVVRQGPVTRTVVVQALSNLRGPALGGFAAEGVEAKRAKTEDRVELPTSPGWAPGRRR